MGYRGIGTDVTHEIEAAKRVEEALKEARDANEAKSKFLAVMSHELRTPLNAVIGFSQVIASEMAGPVTQQQAEYLDDVISAGHQLLSLVNDILDLSKIQSDQFSIHPVPLRVGDELRSTVNLMSGVSDGKGVEIEIKNPGDGLELIADARALRQILLNLVTNAVKFTPQGGMVSLSCTKSDEWIEISVADTGIGISSEDIDRIKEPFQQVEDVLVRHHKGSGLGLSIVNQLMLAHKGQLIINSEIDKGTVVSVKFPVHQK